MPKHKDNKAISEAIIDAALVIAKKNNSWESVRLTDVADSLNIDLHEIHQYFIEKDQLIDALLNRADQALIKSSESLEIYEGATQNLHQLLMAWFGELNPHRAIVKQMIWSKLELGHVHVQLPAILRISRTVQWWREAAQRKAVSCARALDEIGLTTIFIVTLIFWLSDHSRNAENTSKFLHHRLEEGSQVLGMIKNIFGLDLGVVRKKTSPNDIIAR